MTAKAKGTTSVVLTVTINGTKITKTSEIAITVLDGTEKESEVVDGGEYGTEADAYDILVKSGENSVETLSLNLNDKKTAKLSVAVTKNSKLVEPQAVSYKSSDAKVVAVGSATGQVKAVKEGEAEITVTVKIDDNITKTEKIKVVVKNAAQESGQGEEEEPEEPEKETTPLAYEIKSEDGKTPYLYDWRRYIYAVPP